MGFTFFFVAAVVVAMLAVFATLIVRYRGQRIVTCPETHTAVATEIHAVLAASSWIVTQPRLVIASCSHWPERAGCDQACLSQIEASPEGTLVRNIVAKWYDERTCVYCAMPIHDVGFGAVVPALLSPDGALREWKDVAIEELPRMLESAGAVCARCELVEDFRRRFPNRVIDRREARSRPRRFAVAGPSAAVY